MIINRYNDKEFKIAFTLIELLVVIAIVGILSGLIIVGMSSSVNNARIAKAQIFSASLRDSLLASLVSEWKFEGTTAAESPAQAADVLDSWGSKNGIITTGHVPTVKSGSNCLYGKCLSFDGTNSYFTISPAIHFADQAPYTFAVWVDWGTTSPSTYVIPIGNASASSDIYFVGNSGSKAFSYRAQSQAQTVITGSNTATLFDDNWHFVTWTVDSSRNAKFYIDGVQTGNTQAIPTTSEIYYSNFGGGYDGVNYLWNGAMDEMRVYSDVIPTSQIGDMYYAGMNKLLASGLISREEHRTRMAIQ